MPLPPVFAKISEQERNRIGDLFAQRAAAMPHHDTQVKNEKGNPTHTFTRHGYQTGWESQLVRLVTGRTPDQPDDEEGSRDAVDKYLHKESLPKREQGKITYAKADSVGAFLSPEVELSALTMAKLRAAPLLNRHWAETNAKGTIAWTAYDYIDMVVPGPHALTGVSFVRNKNARKVPEKEAIQAIHDFIHQARVTSSGATSTLEGENAFENLILNSDLALPRVRALNRRTYKLRFPAMQDLLDFLDVQARWMRKVKVVLRRFGSNDWRVHTAYCVDCIEQPVPSSGGPSVKTGKWTGNLRVEENGPVTFVDPSTLA